MPTQMFVILWTPEPTREYGPNEVTGPFVDEEAAQDYLDHCEISEGYTYEIIKLDDPYA